MFFVSPSLHWGLGFFTKKVLELKICTTVTFEPTRSSCGCSDAFHLNLESLSDQYSAMYLFGGLLTLVDHLGVLPAHIMSPVASCDAALSGAGLGGVLATSAYVGQDSLSPCGFSCAGTCGASGM